MMAQTAGIGLADDADKLFEGVGIGRRLAVVVSFPQPFRILGIAPCRLTSSAQPLEHALAPPSSPSTQYHGAAGRKPPAQPQPNAADAGAWTGRVD